MRPRLTIAIPTFNRADLLGRAIESALAQTSREIEILVSDNGSVDDTPAVIARYAGRGLRTFRHEKTMSAARNGEFLINQAQGEFFVGLSDDDFLLPEFTGLRQLGRRSGRDLTRGAGAARRAGRTLH